MEIWTTFTFEASHSLEQPLGVKTLHGHSYWVECFFDTTAESPTPLPMLEGYCALVKSKLDHKHLNDIMENPTMESIAKYISCTFQLSPTKIVIRRESLGCGVVYIVNN